MAGVLFYSIAGKDILTSPTSGSTLENVPVVVENLDSSLELSRCSRERYSWIDWSIFGYL